MAIVSVIRNLVTVMTSRLHFIPLRYFAHTCQINQKQCNYNNLEGQIQVISIFGMEKANFLFLSAVWDCDGFSSSELSETLEFRRNIREGLAFPGVRSPSYIGLSLKLPHDKFKSLIDSSEGDRLSPEIPCDKAEMKLIAIDVFRKARPYILSLCSLSDI